MVYSNEDYLTNLLRSTRSLLESIGGVEALQQELDYYEPSGLRAKFPTVNHIHIRLCDSIRNTQRMRLVITDQLFETIAEQLLRCTLDLICGGGVELVTQIIQMSCQLSEDGQNKKRSWGIFKQGVVESSCYLRNFESPKQFYSYIDSKVHTVDEAWSLALELDPIKGIGPSLACDFLKEVGVEGEDKEARPGTRFRFHHH